MLKRYKNSKNKQKFRVFAPKIVKSPKTYDRTSRDQVYTLLTIPNDI